jgi:hypothetical protein
LTGTNGGICSSGATVAVYTNSLPAISISPPGATVCAQTPVTFSASGITSFTWSNGGGNNASASYTPNASTVYTVSGPDALTGCIGSRTVGVTTNSLPVISIAGNPAVCLGQSSTLTANGAGSYSWTGGALTATLVITPSVNTTYIVTGTNTAGCVSTSSLSVITNSLPVVTVAQSATAACIGSAVGFTASGALLYTWSGIGAANPVNVTINATQIYLVTGIGSSGCASSQTVSVLALPLPTIAVSPPSATVCLNSTSTFTASGASTYTWSQGASGNTVALTATSNAVYFVTGSNANGCTASATLAIATKSLPVLSVLPTGATVCAMSPVSFTASGAASYTWSHAGGTGPTALYVPSSGNTYTVNGTGANGCSGAATVGIVAHPLPNVQISPASAVICAGDSLELTASGAFSYTWNPGNVNASTIKIAPDTAIVYIVSAVDLNNCPGTAQASVTVDMCTGVHDWSSTGKGIYLYPNPSSGKVTVEFAFGGQKQITVFTETGQRILDLRSAGSAEQIDLSGFAKGLYNVHVSANGMQVNFRLIID